MRFILGLTALLAIAATAAVVLQELPRGQYKRIHQKELKRIVGGKAGEAASSLEKILEKHPKDVESRYMLVLALAAQGRLDDALPHAQKALQDGLPPGRFVSGPQALRSTLQKHEGFRSLTAKALEKEKGIVHGPMIGAVTHDSARIWVRMAKETEVKLSASPSSGKPVTAEARATAKSDLTAVVQLKGLKPDTTYRISHEGTELGSLRTSPPPGTKSKFSLAFGGGAGYVPPHERMWNTIASLKPRMLFLLGDNVYSDDPTTPEMQRYCYARRQSRPEYRKLLSTTPVYAIWDDHDFGTNDCLGGAGTDDPPWKRPVWRVFCENWVNPSYGGGEAAPGCWFSFSFGDVDFIFLDGRYYRTNPKKPNPSMLGPVQLKWLQQQLQASRGTFKVICSPVPWTFRAKGKSLDTWNGFQEEREKIFGFIEKNKIEGVVLMSADRHRSDAWKIERPDGYDLYEFNSSRLTNQHVHGTMKEAIFSYNATQSFGLVDFDTTAADPSVTYRVVTIAGKVVNTLKLTRRQLAFK